MVLCLLFWNVPKRLFFRLLFWNAAALQHVVFLAFRLLQRCLRLLVPLPLSLFLQFLIHASKPLVCFRW